MLTKLMLIVGAVTATLAAVRSAQKALDAWRKVADSLRGPEAETDAQAA